MVQSIGSLGFRMFHTNVMAGKIPEAQRLSIPHSHMTCTSLHLTTPSYRSTPLCDTHDIRIPYLPGYLTESQRVPGSRTRGRTRGSTLARTIRTDPGSMYAKMPVPWTATIYWVTLIYPLSWKNGRGTDRCPGSIRFELPNWDEGPEEVAIHPSSSGFNGCEIKTQRGPKSRLIQLISMSLVVYSVHGGPPHPRVP